MLLLIIFGSLFAISLTGFIIFNCLKTVADNKYWNISDELRPLEYKDDNFTNSEKVQYQRLKKEEKNMMNLVISLTISKMLLNYF